MCIPPVFDFTGSMAESVLPSLQTIRDSVTRDEKKICVVPIYKQVNIEDDPVTAYSKLYGKDTYLFELASEGDPTKISVSIIGVHPFKTLQTFRDKDPNGGTFFHSLVSYKTPLLPYLDLYTKFNNFVFF